MAAGDVAKSLLAQVRYRLGAVATAGWTDAQIYSCLNQGQTDLGWRLKDAVMPTAITTGTMTASRFSLPDTFWRERLLQIGTSQIVARRWFVSELDSLEGNALQIPSATTPYYYLWYNLTDTAVVVNVEVGNTAATDAYRLLYVSLPVTMSDSIDPLYGDALLPLLVDFAVARARQGRAEYGEAERVWKDYLGGITLINSRYGPGPRAESKPGDMK